MTSTMDEDRPRLAQLLTREPSPDRVDAMIGLEVTELGPHRVAAVVTLTRPTQHNALNLRGWQRLAEVFSHLRSNTTLRAVVIRGAGERAFSAGADISEFPTNRLTPDHADTYNTAIANALTAVQDLPVPVIAMIDGLAVGGGCELAAACDIRIATTRSRFGIPIGRLGVTLGLTEMRAVTASLGAANLMYLVATGKLLDATQAASAGFLQQLVPPEDLHTEVRVLVENIAAASETTIRATKVTARLSRDQTVSDSHPTLRGFHDEVYAGPDLKEGVAAFLSGRTPNFTAERTAADGRP